MRLFGLSLLGFALILISVIALAQNDGTPLDYPKAKTVDQVDDYHGVKVADPYRWLEDTDSADTHDWVEAENKLTFSYLDQIPYRGAIRERMTKLWNYERFTVPSQQGGRYFFEHNDGLQNQNVLLVAESLNAEPRVLLDPNTLSADGTVALSGTAMTDDGKFMAYGTAASGSDWMEWHVRDVDTGKDLPDLIKWVKFSGASWTKDGKGFFYSRYDEPKDAALRDANYFQKLYYHVVGTSQAGRQADLRASRQQGTGIRRRSHRRRSLSGHHRMAGHVAEEPPLLQGPDRSRTAQVVRVARRFRRAISVRRQRRAGVLDSDRSRCAARPADRDRYEASGAGELEDGRSAGRGQARGIERSSTISSCSAI